MSLLLQPLDFLLDPGQHPAAGDVDGAGGHAERLANFAGGLALDGGAPERLPGGRLHLALHAPHGQRHQVALVFLVPRGGQVPLRLGELLQPPLRARVPAALCGPVPPGVTTVTSTTPALPAGAVTVRLLPSLLTVNFVVLVVPNRTAVAPVSRATVYERFIIPPSLPCR